MISAHALLRPLVWVLAAVAVGLLAPSVVLVVEAWRARAVGPVEVGPVLARHGVQVPLPSGTSLLDPEERLFYAGDDGRAVAAVRGPAVLVPDACADVPGSSRGFVGLVRSGRPGASTGSAHRALVGAWAEGLERAIGAPVRASPVDADVGVRTDLAGEVRVRAPCQPERVSASLLTLAPEGGGRPVTVVLVRDVGAADEVGGGLAELVLAGVRRS